MILASTALWLAMSGPSYPMDAPIPPRPALSASDELQPQPPAPRAPGTPATLFVNFDGVSLEECNPSSSKENCHWYNFGTFEPFSGTQSVKVGILQAMRMDAGGFGLRITGVRPGDDEDYTMVVYGGTEQSYGALGSAPSGDCLNDLPNQIAFAHVDGELNDWVNGGATTALHEAGHSWGLDHIEPEGSIMFPSGDNGPTSYRDACDPVVMDTELTPGPGSCPELNMQFCGDPNLQNSTALLQHMFGPPYVDSTAPDVELVEPVNGEYFQGPADFDIVLEIEDDLHPQAYSIWAWINDDPMPEDPSVLATTELRVTELPIGDYEFHLVVADDAGNETRLDFDIEVGEDPPPEFGPSPGCGCRAGPRSTSLGWFFLVVLAPPRRRR